MHNVSMIFDVISCQKNPCMKLERRKCNYHTITLSKYVRRNSKEFK